MTSITLSFLCLSDSRCVLEVENHREKFHRTSPVSSSGVFVYVTDDVLVDFIVIIITVLVTVTVTELDPNVA